MPITVGFPIEISEVFYNVLSIIGRGGLSIVYLAENAQTGDKVAIKEFLYHEFYDPITKNNDCNDFFENEVLNTMAQARSGLECVEVIAYEVVEDEINPEYYIVLSYIEGQTFLEFYRDFIQLCRGLEHLDLSSIMRNIFIPLAKLLDYCHSTENIVHRDFAVQNIMIIKDEDGDFRPVLIDWGVSKYVGENWISYCPKPYICDEMPKDIPINQKGAPPEIKFGYMPTAASDIYYFAHLMYFVFTGGIMREDSEILSKSDYVLNPKKVNWYLPEEFNQLVIKLSQYEPADRPKNMKEVIKLLEDLIQIKQIHFDFHFFMEPDTDEILGVKIDKGSDEL